MSLSFFLFVGLSQFISSIFFSSIEFVNFVIIFVRTNQVSQFEEAETRDRANNIFFQMLIVRATFYFKECSTQFLTLFYKILK